MRPFGFCIPSWEGQVRMHVQVSCPQCQGRLKLLEPLVAGKSVVCPGCRLQFVPLQPLGMDSAGLGAAGMWLLLLLVVILGGGAGVLVWSKLTEPDSGPAVVAENKKAGELEVESPSKMPAEQPAETSPSPSTSTKTESPPLEKSATPAPLAPPKVELSKVEDELPDAPPPKKSAPAASAQKKPPAVEELPAPAVKTPMPPPAPKEAAPAPASAPPIQAKVPHLKQKEINDAIDKGVAYLKQTQAANGTWGPAAAVGVDTVGYAALGGLTLLECQVPPNDAAVQKAAQHVRTTPVTIGLHRTYQMACAILFLDKLGDPRDKRLIQNYALRLVGGQTSKWGWGYDDPDFTEAEFKQLLTFLEATRLPVVEPTVAAASKESDEPMDDVPPKKVGDTAPKKSAPRPKPAVPALRSLLPRVAAIPVVAQHYFPNAAPALGPAGPGQPAPLLPPMPMGKPPSPGKGPPGFPVPGLPQADPGNMAAMMAFMSRDDNSNSQFALLALWVARRHGVPAERCHFLASQRFLQTQNFDGGWGYHIPGTGMPVNDSTPTMTCVGLLGLAMGHGVTPPAKGAAKAAKDVGKEKTPLPDDPAIAKGLQKLGQHIDAASMTKFYLLWSVERVGVLYNLKTIGNRDWYDVGVQMLLPAQQPDGAWSGSSYTGSSPSLDTCFALLFLKRSNLVQDLTDRLPLLRSISDPAAR